MHPINNKKNLKNMKFEELDLNDNVLDSLYDMQFEDCTPVQENCIPEILKGNDLLGVAQTGTGKTAAYLLPILSKLDDGGYPKDAVNCVIMSPTRELAQQIDQAMQGFSYYVPGVSSVAVYGGNDGNRYDQEQKSMRLGADVIIATPGRLISHISMGNIDLSRVSFFVLDEADRMLDMGFSEDIMKIASKLPKTCQTIMFSATMPKDIEKLAQSLLKNPAVVKLAVSKPAEKIKQSAYICYETQKLEIIKDIFKAGDLKRVIVFSGSKQKVKHINQAMQRLHINCGEMHSDLEQAERDDIMFKFKSGQIDVLVATDIVARGIDIDDIAMVINYDVPHDAEDYVHRIGRTARAERDGVAITMVNEDDMFAFRQIEKFLEKDILKNPLPEGCGEGPEYTTSRRPGKTSAKSRRRKDRDNTAHRDAKQHDRAPRRGDRQKQNNDRQKPNDDAQKQGGTQQKQDNASPKSGDRANKAGQDLTNDQRQGQDAAPNKEQGANQRGNRRRNGQRGSNRNADNGQHADRNPNAERPAVDENRQRRRNNSRKPKNRRPNAENGSRRNDKAAAASARTEKNDGGIKSLIKKPLKWLRSLGKK
ncbi:DEAD/DEAH box family ATP-dependent RNA helicase [Prevotella dentalis DSM 3688]|uniref:DEAD/DEAH box family ATP-dependent RNA helicase n=2 Tax=Prevotella dentalis (strain ATCC 49559 / DSM 3688 / JCM 13448 / NCTC 12043 / ES 2772) TaxID=908937 RepID=F9D1C7_PREDD|nr:DEAD/DEAH box family ATP-dependent RNA helicase [Prevotella dentalis DSM 3688]